jgi:hypothetical protein
MAAAALLAPLQPARADASADQLAYGAQMRDLWGVLDRTVTAYADRTSDADPRYYADGAWVSPITNCWTCTMGPAMGAAVLVDERPELLPVVVATVDRAIREHQRANGAFYGPGNSDAIQTAWAVPILGTIYLTIGDRVDAATRDRWAASIVAGADWLLSAGETVWYVNGNINLSYTEALWIAWKISGDQRFRAAYEASWSFTIDPPKPRWAAYGLRITSAPTRADGSDGAGYLVESGGFDPEYTMAQVEVASSWYALSREPRALRLMNLLINQLLPRVDAKYTLDARDGSRHSLLTPFMTSALSAVVASGSRPDLVSRLPAQLARVSKEYAGAITYTHPSFYRGVGGWLATPLIISAGLPKVPVVPSPAPVAPPVPAPTTPVRQHGPVAPAPRKPAVRQSPASTPVVKAVGPSVRVASRARIRSGSLRLVVRAPRGTSVSVRLRCGRSTCGRARMARQSSGRSTVRIRISRSWRRVIRRARTRRASLVVTVRSASGSHVVRRRVTLVG